MKRKKNSLISPIKSIMINSKDNNSDQFDQNHKHNDYDALEELGARVPIERQAGETGGEHNFVYKLWIISVQESRRDERDDKIKQEEKGRRKG